MASFWIRTGFLFALLTLQILAAEDEKSPKARLEVKAFINDDAGKYPDLEVKYIGGIDPRMLILENGEEKERIDIAEMSRAEINELLTHHGLTQQEELNDMEEEGTDDAATEEPVTEKPNDKIEF